MTENNQEELFLSEHTSPTSFLPQHIHLTSYYFNISNYKENLYQSLNIHCPQSIQNSVIKRQAEYLAGRYAASMIFQRLHMPINNVLIGNNRSPIWPQGMVASISHSNTVAICAAALDNNYQYLGVDIERRLSLELVTEIKKSIINNNEENLLLSLNDFMSFTDAFTLVFSAKESLFKALHPQVNSYFDFSAAELLNICNKTKQFQLVLLQDLSLKLKAGTKFTGNFYFDGTHVTTLIAQ